MSYETPPQVKFLSPFELQRANTGTQLYSSNNSLTSDILIIDDKMVTSTFSGIWLPKVIVSFKFVKVSGKRILKTIAIA